MADRTRKVPPQPTEGERKRTAGARLKRAVHIARARAGLTSDVQVATKANVSYDTLMNWYGGRTVPRPFELKKVADALQTSYADLWSRYEGVDPEPLPLQDAIRELIPVLSDLVAELRLTRAEQVVATETMLEALGALGSHPGREGRRAGNGREAHVGTGQ